MSNEPESTLTVPVDSLHALRQPKHILWQPKPDITAYELAQSMGVLLSLSRGGMHIDCEDAISTLPAEVQRHFVIG